MIFDQAGSVSIMAKLQLDLQSNNLIDIRITIDYTFLLFSNNTLSIQ